MFYTCCSFFRPFCTLFFHSLPSFFLDALSLKIWRSRLILLSLTLSFSLSHQINILGHLASLFLSFLSLKKMGKREREREREREKERDNGHDLSPKKENRRFQSSPKPHRRRTYTPQRTRFPTIAGKSVTWHNITG